MIKTLKRKVNIDYSAPHNRQMLFRMRLLKFYKEIEYDEDIGTLPWEYVNKIEKLRLKHEEEKKKKWQEIKNKQATKRGLQVRAIVNKFKR